MIIILQIIIYIIHINISEQKHKRLNQQEFRDIIIKKYKACVITNNQCIDELEACHIIEVKDNGSYDVNNGLLLERNLHSTFDKNYWCINPNTLEIEIKHDHNGTIIKYNKQKVNIEFNPILYNNLLVRYNLFYNIC